MFQRHLSTSKWQTALSLLAAVSIIFIMAASALPAQAEDMPGMPMILYGVVNANGSAIGAGYWVEARINSSTIASCQTNSSSQYGYSSNTLTVPGASGNTIYFFINGVQAATTVAFSSGAKNQDIQVTGTIPTSYTPPTTNITISTASLSSGVVGSAYSSTLAATGGSGSYTWSLTSGSLPTGLNLSTAGAISGTPTAASTYTFTIKATDTASSSRTASTTYSVTVSTASSSSTLSISTSSLSSGTVNSYYSSTLSATGGSGAYTWALSSGALPTGMSFSSSGAISGTPTASSTFSFTVLVTDTASHSASQSYSIYVAPAVTSSTTTTSSSSTSSTATSSGTSTSASTGTSTSGSQTSSTPTSSAVAAFSISNMTATPVSASRVNITIDVTNTGKAAGTKAFTLKVNNNVEALQEVLLEPGESKVVTFTVNKTTPGSYKASIDPLSTDFTVAEGKSASQSGSDTASTIVWGVLIAGILLVILLVLLLVYKKKQSDYY